LVRRNVLFVENRLDRTFVKARITVDAFNWVDIKHLVTIAKAIAGANDDAIGVFASETILRHDIRHAASPGNEGMPLHGVHANQCRAAASEIRDKTRLFSSAMPA
jgi:hypothetical protein